MRTALIAVFEEPERSGPASSWGKLRDILALVTLGTVLLLSVAVSGVATKLRDADPRAARPRRGRRAVCSGCSALALGLAASTVLFFAFFRVLAHPNVPTRSLWSGALLGAVAFEAAQAAVDRTCSQATEEQPAVQAFGIALILRGLDQLLLARRRARRRLGAHLAARLAQPARRRRSPTSCPRDPRIDLAAAAGVVRPSAGAAAAADPATSPKVAFAAGAASMLGLVALVRRRR